MNLRSLLGGINAKEIVSQCFTNYHAKGVNYIHLHGSKELTVKLYVLDPTEIGNDFIFDPHENMYDFTAQVICGEIEHNLFAESEVHHSSLEVPYEMRYRFLMKDTGEVNINLPFSIPLLVSYRKVHTVGQEYFVKSNQVASIRLPSDKFTALLISQYHKHKDSGFLYLKDKNVPNNNGLYESMSLDRLIELAEKVCA